MKGPAIRVIVQAAPRRKGWLWQQVVRNGAVGAVSPKTYDSKALAKRAGQRQVDVLNESAKQIIKLVEATITTPELTTIVYSPYAVLVVNE